MMTVHELADYLRIKERKVYDLISQKQIPCTRVVGKWLFPRHTIDLWLMQHSESVLQEHYQQNIPQVVVGSHDPLLEWSLHETDSSLAIQTTGSLEGLNRFENGEAVLCGVRVLNAEGEYNTPFIKDLSIAHEVVAIEWAKRQQGLLVAPNNPLNIRSLADVITTKARFIERQLGSGSQVLLEYLLAKENISVESLNKLPQPARTEMDIALNISADKADVGIAVEAVARQLKLDFIPLAQERFDLVMRRRDYFKDPLQTLFAFVRTTEFKKAAKELKGYDIQNLGKIVFNG